MAYELWRGCGTNIQSTARGMRKPPRVRDGAARAKEADQETEVLGMVGGREV